MSVIDQNQCSKMTLSVIIVISALAIFSAGECAWSDAQYLVPKGGIILWSGTENRIPKGWVVCDGTHGSPDLRDRFVIGSGGGATNKPFSSGGLASVTPSVTVQDTALTEAQMPNHNHGSETEIEDNENIYYDARSVPEWYVSTSENYKVRTDRWLQVRVNHWSNCTKCQHTHKIHSNGGNQPHTHIATSSEISLNPPFYALIYIMKL
ncbi:unnamed protein product [Didymodactylos carnosus]|uniref:Tail fiber protein n=1 Tax=Didymodactylos carnosus TaxID=1234261 RepID=A0A815G6K6_9BILA|nr:unnamed protein product [Didymodactylos carnosus]CAF4190750.1 unnamed protein product [Didymodactylos carnosus]